MPQKTNLDIWTDFWNKTNPLSELTNEDQLVSFWNQRSGDFAQKIASAQSRKRSRENLALLSAAGFCADGARVLDIGCGPGALSLPLARAGAQVTSFDISPGMLAQLREAAEREGLAVETIEGSWWTADIDRLGFKGKFDLVISSMTPAIKDAETLDRMMACSKDYCFYIGSFPGSRDAMLQDLLRQIKKAPAPGRSPMGFLFPFMYLYLRGYRPEITLNRRKWNEKLPPEKAAGHAIDIISHDQACTDAMKRAIKRYYKETAINGKCTFKNEMFLAMMIWNVTPEKVPCPPLAGKKRSGP
jgi:SAM-dependent methyltransferase